MSFLMKYVYKRICCLNTQFIYTYIYIYIYICVCVCVCVRVCVCLYTHTNSIIHLRYIDTHSHQVAPSGSAKATYMKIIILVRLNWEQITSFMSIHKSKCFLYAHNFYLSIYLSICVDLLKVIIWQKWFW